MTCRSLYRGYAIVQRKGQWRFADTGEPTVNSGRPCGHCGEYQTAEGHDACLGTLPGVRNACCGHSEVRDAYVQFPDGQCIRGQDAITHCEVTT